jgi:hypothetical protein
MMNDGVQSGGASGGPKLTETKQHTVLLAFVTDGVASYYALFHAEERHITTACDNHSARRLHPACSTDGPGVESRNSRPFPRGPLRRS